MLSRSGRLVDGHIAPDASAEPGCEDLGITAEGRDDIAVEPAALVLQGAGQIPVVEGDQGLNAVFQQLVNQLVIKAQTGLVDFAVAVGDDAGPADGETVGFDTELFHQGDVFTVAVINIAGNIAGIAEANVPGGGVVAEIVPDARALAVFVPGAFALIGGAGNAPEEVFRKLFHKCSFGNTAVRRRFYERVRMLSWK